MTAETNQKKYMFADLPITDRLEQQLEFVVELDKLKEVLRRTKIASGKRLENSAEHSWHLAMMVLVLAEYAAEPIDVAHTVRLVLVHDVVEIDAGDTYAYDIEGNDDREKRERRAAKRVFGLLPEKPGAELMALWLEFEARETNESRFAHTVDRIMPFLHNILTGGAQWRQNGVILPQVKERMAPVAEGSPALFRMIEALLDRAVAENLLETRGGGGE